MSKETREKEEAISPQGGLDQRASEPKIVLIDLGSVRRDTLKAGGTTDMPIADGKDSS